MSGSDRNLLVDASVFVTLAEIGHVALLDGLAGQVEMPETVAEEISDIPAADALSESRDDWLEVQDLRGTSRAVEEIDSNSAASHLGKANPDGDRDGDVALLAYALFSKNRTEDVVLITDDEPLRKTCKALSIPVSGSIGVLIRAVEREDLSREEAKETLYAMDEVGERLSASLVQRAAQMIDDGYVQRR